jgi:rubrerythrin
MPDFANPFAGKVPDRKLTPGELVRAIRLDLAAEEEAIHQYLAQADVADNPLARDVLTDVANEERQHAGEFLRLLQILTGDEDKWLADGAAEVDKAVAEAAAEAAASEPAKPTANSSEEPTIGSLK